MSKMLKKALALMIIIAMSLCLVAGVIGAEQTKHIILNDGQRVEVEKVGHEYKRELLPEEIDMLGLPTELPEDVERMTGKVIKDMRVTKVEKFEDEMYIYYDIIYKDTPEAKEIQTKLAEDKGEVSIQSHEGAYRLRVWWTDYSSYYNIDRKIGNSVFLDNTRFAKYFFTGVGSFTSNKVLSLFADFLATLINAGNDGDGFSRGWDRAAVKTGQVYTNGRWVDYFEAAQREVYWYHIQRVLNPNNGALIDETTEFFNDANNYWPIERLPSLNFENNTYIMEAALARYNAGWDLAYDIAGYHYYSTDWKRTPKYNY